MTLKKTVNGHTVEFDVSPKLQCWAVIGFDEMGRKYVGFYNGVDGKADSSDMVSEEEGA